MVLVAKGKRKEDEMGRIVVTEFVSMDGVMQAPGGEDFKYEGWTFEFDRGEDGEQFKAQEIQDAEAQLIGRVTYESFAGAWPKYEEEWEGDAKEFARKFNQMPKYVVSSTLKDPEWTNTTVIDGSGDVPKQIAELKEQIDGDILVAGSKMLIDELIENDLVDQVNLMVFPVVLGTGFKVFGETSDKKDWKLTES